MSRKTKPTPPSHPPLRDVFQKAMERSGGNAPMAFLDVFAEMDKRTQAIEAKVAHHSEINAGLGKWLSMANDQLERMPTHIGGEVNDGIRRSLPALVQDMEAKAHQGAKSGAQASRAALDALEDAIVTKHTQTRRLRRMAFIGLPAVLCATILFGALFGSLIIPSLPLSWEWPCKIIGAEHYRQDGQASFCLIRR